MTDILNKTTVLVLNRNWQAINIRTPQEAFCMMATNVATGLDIEGENHQNSVNHLRYRCIQNRSDGLGWYAQNRCEWLCPPIESPDTTP
jgi:hypothetical protein